MYFYPFADPVKKLVAVYFEKYSKRVVKEKNTSKVVSTVQAYASMLQNHTIHFDLKPFISGALEYIVNLDLYKAIKIELGTTLITELREANNNENDGNVNFSYLIFCGRAIFGNYNFSEETRDFAKNTFKEYLKLNLRLLKMAEQYSTTNKENFVLVAKLIKEYSELIKLFLKRLGVLDIDSTKLLYL